MAVYSRRWTMAVRRRMWRTKGGERREAWIVDYLDAQGHRHIETYGRRADAQSRYAKVQVDIGQGIHTPINQSPTVAEAAELWLQSCTHRQIERTTMETYRQQVALHLLPFIGSTRLAQLTTPMVRSFVDELHQAERSPAMIKKVLVRLSSILTDAQERGLVAQNVVRNLRRRGTNQESRIRGKLKVGENIPAPDEIRAMIAALQGHWRPLLLTAIFTGLRASELRALRWSDINLKHHELHVRQRADRYNTMGRPKSAAGERTIPIPPILANTLKEHRLASEHDLVFANGRGNVENWANIVNRGFHPAQIKAGVVTKDDKPKYTGLHALRPFYASWCINRRADGGLELPLKVVQARLGHASISMTADTYGHLFPRGDDGVELAAAERAFLT
jgi:integrase